MFHWAENVGFPPFFMQKNFFRTIKALTIELEQYNIIDIEHYCISYNFFIMRK